MTSAHSPIAVDRGRVAASLLAHPEVEDCAVLLRARRDGGQDLVAYVVTSMPSVTGRLQAELHAGLPDGIGRAHCVAISHVPLTDDGRVDKRALETVPVIDGDLVERWVEQWRARPGVEQVAVVLEDQLEPVAEMVDEAAEQGRKEPAAPGPSATLVEAQPRPPAISHGAPLRDDADSPAVLSEILQRAARYHPAQAVICIQPDGSETVLTYPALLERAQRVLAGLRGRGMAAGEPVLFQLERTQDFLAAFWACVLGGFVPVPVPLAPSYRETNGAVVKLQHAGAMLGRPLILTDATRAPALAALPSVLGVEPMPVEAVEDLARHAPDARAHPADPDDVALMLLSSGSTGRSKTVMQSHRSLLGHCAGNVQLNAFTSGDVSLNWIPLDHVGAIVMLHLCKVYLGCRQVHAPAELVLREPLRWLDWIERYRATVTWAPNFAFSMVNDHAEEIGRRHWDLSSMRFIVNGGEAVVARTARRFLELLAPHGLPATAIRPAWGMSETSSAAIYADRFTRASSSDEDAFVCVGSAIPGFAMRIVDAQDGVLGEGVVGRLQVRGRQVTSGYYGDAEQTREAFTADGWFTTGDLGRLEEGRLTITGREKDVIIVNGVNYYSHEIEAAAEEVDGVDVSYVAACAVRESGSATDEVAIFFSARVPAERHAALARDIRAAVRRKTGVSPRHLVAVRREDIPKTSIGKIQRAELRQRFERGEFLAGARATSPPPALVHRRVWRRRDADVAARALDPGRVLVFMDEGGFGQALCGRLEAAGAETVRVTAGAGFARVGAGRYHLDPACADDYARLLADLAEGGIQPSHVVHVAGRLLAPDALHPLHDLEPALERTCCELLYLVQALAGRRLRSGRLLMVSRHAQAVGDEPVAVEAGALLGLLRTASQELPWLRCRHLDLPSTPTDIDVDCVMRELQGDHPDAEVAYREGRRYVPRLERVTVSDEPAPPVLQRGGLYLLTGGLGGVSAEIAADLLRRYDARLLLIGRTPLPEATAGTAPRPDGVTERLATYRMLRERSAHVRYEAVDVCDLQGLRDAVKNACGVWGCELAGVVHQAGVFTERLLTEETLHGLVAAMRPKVVGAWTLHKLLSEHPGAVFLASSSVNGLFGGFGVGAYAAANAFLDGFAHYQRTTDSVRSYAIAWSLWDEVGMSRGYAGKGLARSRGYRVLAPREALEALEIALAQPPGHVVIGLDEGNRHIRRHLASGVPGTRALRAYFTGQPAAGGDASTSPPVLADAFGTPTRCSGRPLTRLPLTSEGGLDQQALGELEQPGLALPRVSEPPRTDLERILASAWCEVLGVGTVGIHDNFFDLGGDSVRIAQLGRRLGEVLGRDVALTDLFQHPTISASANYWGGVTDRAADPDLDGRRGQARRERTRRRSARSRPAGERRDDSPQASA
jgi:acyl-CoA synthetase (AMP-forming)/AMP-acid ligase II/aryl carrier-like protein